MISYRMNLKQPLAGVLASALVILVSLGFVSLFPFHSWAPPAYASAPTPAAMLHAGILKKFAIYGLIRIGVPMLHEGFLDWLPIILALLIGFELYGIAGAFLLRGKPEETRPEEARPEEPKP